MDLVSLHGLGKADESFLWYKWATLRRQNTTNQIDFVLLQCHTAFIFAVGRGDSRPQFTTTCTDSLKPSLSGDTLASWLYFFFFLNCILKRMWGTKGTKKNNNKKNKNKNKNKKLAEQVADIRFKGGLKLKYTVNHKLTIDLKSRSQFNIL